MEPPLTYALLYTTASFILHFLLILDTVSFILNRKIEYGIGAVLWTIMIYVFI